MGHDNCRPMVGSIAEAVVGPGAVKWEAYLPWFWQQQQSARSPEVGEKGEVGSGNFWPWWCCSARNLSGADQRWKYGTNVLCDHIIHGSYKNETTPFPLINFCMFLLNMHMHWCLGVWVFFLGKWPICISLHCISVQYRSIWETQKMKLLDLWIQLCIIEDGVKEMRKRKNKHIAVIRPHHPVD